MLGTHLTGVVRAGAARPVRPRARAPRATWRRRWCSGAPLVAADPLPARARPGRRLAWLLAAMPPMGARRRAPADRRRRATRAIRDLADQRTAAGADVAAGSLLMSAALVAIVFSARCCARSAASARPGGGRAMRRRRLTALGRRCRSAPPAARATWRARRPAPTRAATAARCSPQRCSACHGADARGVAGKGPSLRRRRRRRRPTSTSRPAGCRSPIPSRAAAQPARVHAAPSAGRWSPTSARSAGPPIPPSTRPRGRCARAKRCSATLRRLPRDHGARRRRAAAAPRPRCSRRPRPRSPRRCASGPT